MPNAQEEERCRRGVRSHGRENAAWAGDPWRKPTPGARAHLEGWGRED